MSKSKQDTGYLLLVDMYVARQNVAKFEQRMRKFLYPDGETEAAFTRLDPTFDNQLILALKSQSGAILPEGIGSRPFHPNMAGARNFLTTRPIREDRRPGVRSKVAHYVHVWTLPDLEDLNLAKRMEFCSEDQSYMDLDETVLAEVQNFTRSVQWDDPYPAPDPKKTFVMATRQFEYGNLAPYMFNLRGLSPFLQDWQQLAQVQNVTGRLNRVTEFWQTTRGGALPLAPAGASAADQAAWQKLVRQLDGYQASMELETFEWAPYQHGPKPKPKANSKSRAKPKAKKR
jgi:hypothetical protein